MEIPMETWKGGLLGTKSAMKMHNKINKRIKGERRKFAVI